MVSGWRDATFRRTTLLIVIALFELIPSLRIESDDLEIQQLQYAEAGRNNKWIDAAKKGKATELSCDDLQVHIETCLGKLQGNLSVLCEGGCNLDLVNETSEDILMDLWRCSALIMRADMYRCLHLSDQARVHINDITNLNNSVINAEPNAQARRRMTGAIGELNTVVSELVDQAVNISDPIPFFLEKYKLADGRTGRPSLCTEAEVVNMNQWKCTVANTYRESTEYVDATVYWPDSTMNTKIEMGCLEKNRNVMQNIGAKMFGRTRHMGQTQRVCEDQFWIPTLEQSELDLAATTCLSKGFISRLTTSNDDYDYSLCREGKTATLGQSPDRTTEDISQGSQTLLAVLYFAHIVSLKAETSNVPVSEDTGGATASSSEFLASCFDIKYAEGYATIGEALTMMIPMLLGLGENEETMTMTMRRMRSWVALQIPLSDGKEQDTLKGLKILYESKPDKSLFNDMSKVIWAGRVKEGKVKKRLKGDCWNYAKPK